MSDEDDRLTPGKHYGDSTIITDDKSLIIFGRDISKIPCFRNSLLYGIVSGLSLGLGHFMFTSRPLASSNFAVYSFSAITLIYWTQCRYTYSKSKFEMLRVQQLLRQQALYEGTAEERQLDEKLKFENQTVDV